MVLVVGKLLKPRGLLSLVGALSFRMFLGSWDRGWW